MKLLTLPLLLGAVLTASLAQAQQNYVVTSVSAPYAPLSNGTPVSFSSTDDGYASIPLNFTFPYYGQNITTIGLNTNGLILLAPATQCTSGCYSPHGVPSSTSTPHGFISPWWDDFSQGPPGAEVRYVQTASDISIEYHNWGYLGVSSETFEFTVNLNASGMIQVHYGTHTPSTHTGIANGWEDATGGQGGNLLPCGSNIGCTPANWPTNTLFTIGQPVQADLYVEQVLTSNLVRTGNDLTIDVQPKFRNFGQTAANNFHWKAYLSTDKVKDAADVPIYDSSVNGTAVSVAPTSTFQVPQPVTASATNVPAGNYYVLVEADTTGAVTEFSETNNTSSSTNYFTFGMDMVAVGISGPASTGPGNTNTVSLNWFNQGTDSSGPFPYEVIFSADTTYDSTDFVVANLNDTGFTGAENRPAQQVTLQVPMTVPGGDFYWCLRIPPIANEASSTNNFACASSKTHVFQADLEAISADLKDPLTGLSTRTLYASSPARMSVNMSNLGGADAKNFTICAVISSDSNLSLLNDTIAYEYTVANVPAGTQSQTADFTFTVPTTNLKGQAFQSGNYYLFAILDCGGDVTELNEGNNTHAVGQTSPEAVNLRSPASDYVVARIEAPAMGAVGETLPVFRIFKNVGNQDGQKVTYRFYASANDIIDVQDPALPIVGDNGQLLDSGEITLARDQVDSATQLVRIPATLPQGTWYIGAIIDVAKTEPELEEGNNAALSPTMTQIVPSAMTITLQQLPDATVGLPYAFKLSVTGADGPVTWTKVEDVPGFTLSQDGVLSGVSTTTQVTAFTVNATTGTRSAAARLVLRAVPPSGQLTVTTGSLPPVINSTQKTYEANLGATGGAEPYQWSLVSGSLPNGISLSSDGVFTGAVRPGVPVGERPLLVEVMDALGSRAQAQLKMRVVEPGALVITTLAIPDTMVNQEYITDLNARNADGTPLAKPLTWSLSSGRLPEGLAITTAQDELGLLAGKAIESGVFPISLQVVDAKGRSDVADFILRVHAARMKLSAVNQPAVIHPGDELNFQITTGNPESRYRLYAGALPPGITINETGTVAGTVEENAVGIWNFVVEADSAAAGTNLGAFSLEVTAVPVKTGCSAAPTGNGGNATWLLLFAPVLMFLRKRRSAALASAAALALCVPALAQAQTQPYAVQGPTVAPYQALSGGTSLNVSWSSGANATIPFPFEYFGTSYTSVGVSLHGYLIFGSGSTTSSTNYGIPHSSSSAPTNLIAAWWDALDFATSAPVTTVKYTTLGTSPNRVFVVEYNNVCNASFCSGTARMTFQIQLYETSNKIRVHYGPGTGSSSASVGIMGPVSLGVAGLTCTTASSGGCSSGNYPAGSYLEYALPADLQITGFSPSNVGYADVTQQMSAAVTNFGSTDANNVTVGFYLSTDPVFDAADIRLGTSSPAVNVPVKATKVVSAAAKVPANTAEGNYFVLAVADPDGTVSEGLKESNNLSQPIPFTVGPPTPDLSIATLSGPSTAASAATLNVQRIIQNVGNADVTAPFKLTYFVSDNAVVTISDIEVGSVTITDPVTKGGSLPSATDPVTLPASLRAGKYWIGACVDFDAAAGQAGAIAEISEVNNCATGNSFILNTGAVAVVTTALPAATQNSPYGLRLEATGGDGSYTWAQSGGQLPPGLSLNEKGDLTGTPSTANDFQFSVTVASAGGSASQTYTLSVQPKDLPLAIVDQVLPTAEFGRGYTYQLVAVGGKPGYTWSLKAGTHLPAGMGLSPDGWVEGRPAEVTEGVPAVFTVDLKDAAGATTTKDLEIRVVPPSSLHIATSVLQTAYVGKTYKQPLYAIGGTGGYQWSVVKFQRLAQDPTEVPGAVETTLPATFGLTINNATGTSEIYGTPNEAGLYSVTLRTQDNGGSEDITTLPLFVTYDDGLAITTTVLPDAFVGQPYSVKLTTNAKDPATVSFSPACVQQATASGNDFTYSCVVPDSTQQVPAGLTLGGDGSISGVATTPVVVPAPGQEAPAAGSPVVYSFLVKVTDAQGRSDVRSLSIKVREVPKADGGGCSGTGTGPFALALMALFGLGMRRRRA